MKLSVLSEKEVNLALCERFAAYLSERIERSGLSAAAWLSAHGLGETLYGNLTRKPPRVPGAGTILKIFMATNASHAAIIWLLTGEKLQEAEALERQLQLIAAIASPSTFPLTVMHAGQFISAFLKKKNVSLKTFLAECYGTEEDKRAIRQAIESGAPIPERYLGTVSLAASKIFKADISYRALLKMQGDSNGAMPPLG